MDELFDQAEMQHIPTDHEAIEYALDIAEEFYPKNYGLVEEVETILLTPTQLKMLIRYIRTGIKKPCLNPENFSFKIEIKERNTKGSWFKKLKDESVECE